MWPPPIALADLLERACAGDAPPGWLYLPRDWKTWTGDTPAYVIDGDDDEADPDRVDAEAKDRGYACTIDDQTLEDVVRGAERLKARSFAARLEAFDSLSTFRRLSPAHWGTRPALVGGNPAPHGPGVLRPARQRAAGRAVPGGRVRPRRGQTERVLQGPPLPAGPTPAVSVY